MIINQVGHEERSQLPLYSYMALSGQARLHADLKVLHIVCPGGSNSLQNSPLSLRGQPMAERHLCCIEVELIRGEETDN